MADEKKQVKFGGVVQTGPIGLDHSTAPPKNIQDVKQADNKRDSSRVNSTNDGNSADDDSVDVVIVPAPDLPHLRPPSWMTVVEQNLRWTADGVPVIDVVIEFEDIEGATGYDVRVTLYDATDDLVGGI